MANDKWIEGLDADRPIAEAARLALAVRLESVRERIEFRPETPFADADAVHQLRVATRRARAALDAFDICLPKKAGKRTRRALRALRQAAGEVRDCDILIAFLRDLAAPVVLIGFALGLRSAAQERLEWALEKHATELKELCTTLPEQARKPDDDETKTLGDLAAGFPEQLEAFTADHQQTDLHRIRIDGKRLRYAMELFAHCLDPTLRDRLYPTVCALQDHLGALQDATAAIERLDSLRELKPIARSEWPRLQPGIAKVMRGLREKQRAARAAFRKWKSEWKQLVSEAKSVGAHRSGPAAAANRGRRRSREA